MANDALVKGALPIRTYEQFKVIDSNATEVGTTAEAVPATAMANRKGLFIRNMEAVGTYVYLGASNITADSTPATGGFPLNGGETMFLTLDGSCTLYGRSAAGNLTVHTLEVA
jgi:hypothetical protein